MASLDGWSLNKKLDELKKTVDKNYIALGLKLLQLEQRLDIIDDKKKPQVKKKTKRVITTGDA